MALVVGKGTNLQLSVSAVFTTIAQVTSISGLEAKPVTFEPTTLDGGVGIPKKATGYVNTGDLTAEIYYDPALTIHKNWLSNVAAATSSSLKIVFSDSSEYAFTGYLSHSVNVSTTDGVKATLGVTVDGLVTYPT